MKIEVGQVRWDWNGHVSGCDPRAVYVVMSSDKKDGKGTRIWVCGRLSYFGKHDTMFLGGPSGVELLETELIKMKPVGMIPYKLMEGSIGPYEDFMKDREWVELQSKPNA